MGFFSKVGDVSKDMMKGYDKIHINTKLTYEQLYEIIKNSTFSVGIPELTGSGIMKCIKFPPLDKYVIQIAITGQTITITKVYSGAGGLLKESIMDGLSKGWYKSVNSENIELNKATREIGETLSKLLEEKNLLK